MDLQKDNQDGRRVLISVCIATYRREQLLDDLLQSLIQQTLPSELSLEIVVADNSNEASAKTVFMKFKNTGEHRFKYFVQPKKNISLTRNLCIKNSEGELIAFIDDDETASENWISNLYDTMIRFDADGVFGYVEPIFHESIPGYLKKREYYFTKLGRTGSVSSFHYTTNALIKAKLIKNELFPFDPEFGLTGGEDAHLFERLTEKGAKFVDCREAITYEFIPEERGQKKYLFNRALRGGQSYMRRVVDKNKNFSSKLLLFSKTCINFCLGFILYALYPVSVSSGIKGLQRIGASVGKFRALFKNYKMLY